MIDVAEILRRVDLVRLAGELCPGGVAKHGREWRGLCPWHQDKRPSFYVARKGGRELAGCFTCGVHGDAVRVVMECRGVDFRGACEWLAGWCGMGEVPELGKGQGDRGTEGQAGEGPRLRTAGEARAMLAGWRAAQKGGGQ